MKMSTREVFLNFTTPNESLFHALIYQSENEIRREHKEVSVEVVWLPCWLSELP